MNNYQQLVSDIKNDRMVDATRLFEQMAKERALKEIMARRKIVAQTMFNKIMETNGS